MTRAEKINQFLEDDGIVMVTSYTKSWQYEKKHAGMFFMRGEDLHVKSGKSDVCLSNGNRDLVNIQAYRYKS
jgi:hypothetical protein